jgi:hypothetical protein
MKRHLWQAIFLVAAVFGQTGAFGQVSNVEYVIYEELISQIQFERPRLEDFVVDTYLIADWTGVDLGSGRDGTPLIDEYIMGHFKELDPSVFASFEARNHESSPLDGDRFGGLTVALISERQVNAYFEPNPGLGWDRLYDDHPLAQGILTLSRVGVSEDGQHALVYAGNQYHGLAGTGDFYELEKSESGWTIKKRLNIWVS